MADGAQQSEAARLRLTYADQAFVNYCAVLVCIKIEDRVLQREAFEIARDVRGAVNAAHPHLREIVEEFDKLDTSGQAPVRGMALLMLGHALAGFFRWRGALAYDAWAVATEQEAAG